MRDPCEVIAYVRSRRVAVEAHRIADDEAPNASLLPDVLRKAP